MVKPKDTNRLYFPHIEGLRAVAALLVAIYHIYLGRVSGGVDVFFVVSGFLITLSLLHRIDDSGHLHWRGFLSGLALRLLPAAGLVLLLTIALMYLFLPEARYFETSREVLAAFLYVENWQLAVQAVDYLDRDNAQSPVQHYWAMSVQGQFYLIALCIFFAAVKVARSRSVRMVPALAAAYLTVVAVSLGYSIYQTHFGNQVWAYYDTFARVWEFCLGGLFGIAVHVRRDLSLPAVLGWVGLLVIMLVGMIFQVGSVFPGAAALVPTLAAILVLFGGRSDARWSVGRVLGSRPLVSLGAVSYGIYLLHWPLLVVYREVAQVTSVGLVPGVVIIVASVIGAYAIRRLVEIPFLRVRKRELPARRRVIAALGLPLLLGFAGLFALHAFPGASAPVELNEFPGARTLDGSIEWEIDPQPTDFIPELATIKRNLPRSYEDGCHIGLRETIPEWCSYGEQERFTRTLAVVGGSHSAHWLPALEKIAERNGWRIIYSTWSSCRFEVPGLDERCEAIVDSVVGHLETTRPDLLFTTATIGRGREFRGRDSQSFSSDNVEQDAGPPPSYIEAWRRMQDIGIDVFAVRDNPWLETNIPDCISLRPNSPQDCGSKRAKVLGERFDVSLAPDNVHTVDLSNFFCNKDYCPPIIGDIVVYRDRHHLTVEYSRSLSDLLEKHLVRAMANPKSGSPVPPRDTPRLLRGEMRCSATAKSSPIKLEMEVALSGDSLSVTRGSWKERGGSFDAWKGTINGVEVNVTGEYRDVGTNPIRPVTFKGTYVEDQLFLIGTRGPRSCFLESLG